MKKSKKILSLMAFLALALFALNSCKSDTVGEPSPLGPSSIGVILNLTASPNVLSAGQHNRQKATITVTLKKYDGIPLAGKTIYLKTDSPVGSIGFFEDNLNVLVKTTDSNGTVKTTYSGPLFSEIRRDIIVTIEATAAWEGSQFIADTTAINVICVLD